MGPGLQRAAVKSATDDITASPLLRHLRSHDLSSSDPPFLNWTRRTGNLLRSSQPSRAAGKSKAMTHRAVCKRFTLKCSQSAVQEVLCAIWMNTSEEIASIGRFWQFFLDRKCFLALNEMIWIWVCYWKTSNTSSLWAADKQRVSGVDEYSFMSYGVLQNGCINCAIHQWWIREPKLNEKKTCWLFTFFRHWCCGWLVEWLIWCGNHTPIICSSGVLHGGMYHWISWHITRHNSARSPSPPKTDLGAALWDPHLSSPRRLWASAVTGSQTPTSDPWSEFILETVAPVDLDPVCSKNSGQHLQPLASAFTCLGGTF